MHAFVHIFSAEWLKKKRSLAAWLVIAGALFPPLLSAIVFVVHPQQLINMHQSPEFWKLVCRNSWQIMFIMLLPMGIVLAVSLVTQLEFKNNGWKQLHSLPVSFRHIYFSKLAVLLLMLLQLFVLFNIGIYLSAFIPSLLVKVIPFPDHPIDASFFLQQNGWFFVLSLPMVAIQYLLSMQFKNFLVPLGIGLALVVSGLFAISWRYSYILPQAYTALHLVYFKPGAVPAHNLLKWSAGYFLFFTLLGYFLYFIKKEKG